MRNDSAWTSGYTMPKDCRRVVRELSQVPVWLLPSWALWYWLTILCLAVAGSLAWSVSSAVGGLAAAVCVVAIARQMRALECLVHEGSHYNWIRRKKRLNDWLVNLLAGWPLLNEVAEYRAGHLLHHNHFGSARDTDLERHAELNAAALDRKTWGSFLTGLAVRAPNYWIGWFRAIGTNWRVVVKACCWHAAIIAAMSVVLGAAKPVLAAWALFWLVPFGLVLPIVRMIGELSEHVYGEEALSSRTAEEADPNAETVFDATVTNIGPIHRLLFHPFGDGYHLLHHLYPSVPGCRLARLHHALCAADPERYAGQLPVRTRLLERVRHGLYDLYHTHGDYCRG